MRRYRATIFYPLWANRQKEKVTMDYYMEDDQPRMQSIGGLVFTVLFIALLVWCLIRSPVPGHPGPHTTSTS